MAGQEDELMEFEVEFLHETDKAIKVEYKLEDIWLPKSRVMYDEAKAKAGEKIEVEVPIWLARKNGMI